MTANSATVPSARGWRRSGIHPVLPIMALVLNAGFRADSGRSRPFIEAQESTQKGPSPFAMETALPAPISVIARHQPRGLKSGWVTDFCTRLDADVMVT